MSSSREPASLHEHDLFGNGELAVLSNVHELVGDHEVHAHDFLEIAVINGGSGRHLSVHGDPPAQPGDVFVLRPGAWHGFADCRGLVVANVCISATALRTDLGFLRDVPGLYELLATGPVAPGNRGVLAIRMDPGSADRTVAEIERLSELLAGSTANKVVLLGHLLSSLGHIVDNVSGVQSNAAAHPAVASVVDRLEGLPEHPWTLEEMAHVAHLDSSYLIRLFRSQVGLSPIAYLARVRGEKAATLLTHTDQPVARVGALVGWPDPTYFARRFRSLSGMTPTEYRHRARARAGGHPGTRALDD